MKRFGTQMTLIAATVFLGSCKVYQKVNMEQYPGVYLSNDEVQMKVYLPDPEKGLYRATRFDWSGIIGSVKYKGHEYFGYWKKTQDPLFHEDIVGPVEGYLEPGLGYAEAQAGGSFIRIGVGVLEKPDESEYNWMGTYKILDHGTWTIDHGRDWVRFTHKIQSKIGYGYVYSKTIRLKDNGFTIDHTLHNTGNKSIQTDQFNHNFFMIDGQASGPFFKVSFPFNISTGSDLKGYLCLNGKDLNFVKRLADGNSVFVELKGYGPNPEDHQVTVVNRESGAGVTFSVNKPLHRMVFWSCETTLCPENFVWIAVEPGREEAWTSDYTLYVQ